MNSQLHLHKHTVALFALLCLWLLSSTSCTKKEDQPTSAAVPVMLDYIRNSQDLTLLQAAIQRAGLAQDASLSGGGPFTCFAPVDSAMERTGWNRERIAATDPQTLKNILKAHILPGRLSSETMVGFFMQETRSLNEKVTIKVTRNYYGIFMNGISTVQGNIPTGDGVLHKCNGLSLPPAHNLLNLINSRTDLTFMKEIIKQVPGFADHLSNPDPVFRSDVDLSLFYKGITAFVPTDAAFRSQGFNSPADLANADPQFLQKIMGNTMVGGRFFVADMMEGANGPVNWTVQLLRFAETSGQAKYQVLPGGRTFRAKGNLVNPSIIIADITATNGVLHIIDQILQPKS